MKELFFVLAITIYATAMAQRSPGRLVCESDEIAVNGVCQPCYVGNIDVKTTDQIEWMQSQYCIVGNVAVVGPDYGDDGRYTSLDFGQLRAIRGNLIVKMQFIQSLTADYLRVYGWTTVVNCTWLCWQDGQFFLDDVGTGGRTIRAGLKENSCE